MTNVIEVAHISKHFGSTVALENVSFDVPPGVVFALLGENGAGKTTLIRSLLGLERLRAGKISMLGMDPVKDGLAIRRRIGYVSDAPALYRWMTVKQIAHFTASFYSAGFLERFQKMATDFDLDGHQKIRNLSKGGQAKVALALSMAHRPDLLILDEPTSGLDAVVRRHFLESMIDVAAEGRTVFLSSHQVNEVERVADWVGVIRKGKLVACDLVENLKSRFQRWIVTVGSDGFKFDSSRIANLIDHQGQGRKRQQLMLYDVEEGMIDNIRQQPQITDIEAHPATLEEIFVALINGKLASPTAPLISMRAVEPDGDALACSMEELHDE